MTKQWASDYKWLATHLCKLLATHCRQLSVYHKKQADFCEEQAAYYERIAAEIVKNDPVLGAELQNRVDWERVKPLVEAAQIINTEIWWWLPVGHGEDRNLNDTQKGHLYRAYNACKALEAALAQLGEGMIAEGEKKEG